MPVMSMPASYFTLLPVQVPTWNPYIRSNSSPITTFFPSLAQSQSPLSEPSHAELLVRADATTAAASSPFPPTVTTNSHSHAHRPASTTSTAPTLLYEDEEHPFSPLGHAIAAPSNGNGADMNMDPNTDHHVQSTGSETGMQQLSPLPAGAPPAGVSRRHPHAPPLRTASLPLLGGGPPSPQLPRTSSRRRHPSSRFAEYDDPSNMQLADNDAGGGRSATLSRPAYSHSGTATATAGKGGRVSSAAASKLRRQRDSDDTSGDSDVSTGHERRAHRSSANHMSTLGPHHSSPPHTVSHSHTLDHDMASGVAQTVNGAHAQLSEPVALLLLQQHLEQKHTPHASPRAQQRVVTTTLTDRLLTEPAPKTYPQSIPYIAAPPTPSTQTTTHLAHGSSAGSSLEDIQYTPLHPLHPLYTLLPFSTSHLPIQPSVPCPSPRAPSLGATSSPPTFPLPPDHMPFHFPSPVPTQHQGPVQHQGLNASQRPVAAGSRSQPYHQDCSSVPESPMPCTSTPSGESQSSAVTPRLQLLAPCRSRGPSAIIRGGVSCNVSDPNSTASGMWTDDRADGAAFGDGSS